MKKKTIKIEDVPMMYNTPIDVKNKHIQEELTEFFGDEYTGCINTTAFMDKLEKFIDQALSQNRQQVIEEIREYNKGFIRDDGTGEPEIAPEYQVIEDLKKRLNTLNQPKA